MVEQSTSAITQMIASLNNVNSVAHSKRETTQALCGKLVQILCVCGLYLGLPVWTGESSDNFFINQELPYDWLAFILFAVLLMIELPGTRYPLSAHAADQVPSPLALDTRSSADGASGIISVCNLGALFLR